MDLWERRRGRNLWRFEELKVLEVAIVAGDWDLGKWMNMTR